MPRHGEPKRPRSVRNVDRTVRDLEQQISRREKQNTQLQEDVSKGRDKISTLLNTIDELQSSDSQSQLASKRADRELREEREKALRLERENEWSPGGWKGLRKEPRQRLTPVWNDASTGRALGGTGHDQKESQQSQDQWERRSEGA